MYCTAMSCRPTFARCHFKGAAALSLLSKFSLAIRSIQAECGQQTAFCCSKHSGKELQAHIFMGLMSGEVISMQGQLEQRLAMAFQASLCSQKCQVLHRKGLVSKHTRLIRGRSALEWALMDVGISKSYQSQSGLTVGIVTASATANAGCCECR